MANILGIDFGTSKTAAARWDPGSGQPRLIRLGRSRDAVPTVIHADKAGLLSFGEDAADYLQRDATGCVEQIKRQLGQARSFSLHGQDYTAAQLIGRFLRKLREDAEELSFRGAGAERVALAIPALFGHAQREEFREAARAAGFADFELIDEPVAAGFAYFAMASDDPAQRVLVFDWGGGTLDLALIEQAQGAWEVHGELVGGDEYLGGEDFDLLIMEEVNRRLRAAGSRPYGSRPPSEQSQLRQRVRELKHEHARKHGSVEWRLHLLEREEPISWTWSLEEFQALFRETLERAAQCLRELLGKCEALGKKPDFVLLVGGATLFPGLPELLEKQTKIPVRRWEHSADAVALGTVVYAARGVHEAKAFKPDSTRYRAALAMTKSVGRFDAQEIANLKVLAGQLGLSALDCERIECQIFGIPLEDAIALYQARKSAVNPRDAHLPPAPPLARGPQEPPPPPPPPSPNLPRKPVLPPPLPAAPSTSKVSADAGQYIRAAEKLAQEGRVAEALIKADLAATLSPNSLEPFLAKARLYQTVQNHEAVVANASRALEIEPSSAEAFILRGRARFPLNDMEGTVADLTAALEIAPSQTCRLLLAKVLQQIGAIPECIGQLHVLQKLPGVMKRLGFSEVTVETVIVLLRFQIGDIQEDVPKAISGILNSLSRDRSEVARIQNLCSEILGASPGPDWIAALQEKLWEACKLLRVDTRKSAALFVISNPLDLSGVWWQSKPHFLHAVAAVAGSSKVDLVVQCLRLRFSLQPPLTLEELLSEKNLVAAAWESDEIRKLLTPELICEHWKNLFANSLSITNRSGFPITDVQVTFVYEHHESKDRCCSEYAVPHLGSGETKTWENVFNDPGWFGEKIGVVKTSATCAEQNLKIPSVQRHEKK